MAKKSTQKIEGAGWLCWSITFVVLLFPCCYYSWIYTDVSVARFVPIGFGAAVAGFVAGLFTWVVNAIIQNRVERRKRQERKNKKRKSKR